MGIGWPGLEALRAASLGGARQGYSGARPDVVRLLTETPRDVLDVGCGAGVTSALIKQRFGSVRVVGVEPDEELCRRAATHLDCVVQGDIASRVVQDELRALGPFDVVICADVLEHLQDPWAVLKDLTQMLTETGVVVTSIPNIRHYSTFVRLGVFGRWPMLARGIHDATHLRFFSRADILDLGSQASLECIRERRNLRLLESKAWTSPLAVVLDFWPLRAFFTFQYLHVWRKIRSR